MAEVGHSRNATRGAKNDTLARVAEDHIVESALLKAKLDRYIENLVKLIDLIHSFWVFFLGFWGGGGGEMIMNCTFHSVLIPSPSQRTTINF